MGHRVFESLCRWVTRNKNQETRQRNKKDKRQKIKNIKNNERFIANSEMMQDILQMPRAEKDR